LFFGLSGGIELLIVEPSIIDKIVHNKVTFIFPPDLSSGRQAPIRVVLVVFVAVSVLANDLSVFSLIFELFTNISDPAERFAVKKLPEHFLLLYFCDYLTLNSYN
jgi:hypothetical protein